MTLATYTDLKGEVQDKLARTDLASKVQMWVTTAELFITNKLRVREMETVDNTITATSGVITLPSDFLAMNQIRTADDLTQDSYYQNTKQSFRRANDSVTDGTYYWDIVGSNMYLTPAPDDSQEFWFEYYAKPAQLTESTQETNSIYPNYADLYWYGAMWQAYSYIKKQEMAQESLATLNNMIGLYNEQYIKEKAGRGQLFLYPSQVA